MKRPARFFFRLPVLAAALAAAFWAADRAFAAKDFSELSGTEMRKTLEDAHLADDSYGESDAVRDGYKPSGTFMSSKNIELRGTDANGNPIFTFKNLDSFDTYAGTLNRTVGLASGKDKRAPCAYTYDPKTGMISPLTGDSARSAGFNPHPPNFNAQVLEKDGTTHIAFRGSGGSLDDWVDTNTGQMVGGLPPQFEMADKLVESVQEIGSGPIRLSGHSEGAGEVQYATLGSLLRGKTDISGSAFNYQQLSANVRDIFPPEVLEKAKDHLRYVRIGNDPVSGLPMIGVGALGEEYTLDNAEWKGGEGKDDDWRNGWMTKEQLMWLVKGLTDRGEAHRMGNVLDAIQGEIGDKIRFENLPDSVKAALAIAQRDKWMDELAKEMDKYDGRTDLTPEEQAEYEQLKSEYEMWQLDKEWYQDKMKKALEEEEQKKKEEAKKAEEEAAKKAAKEAGVEFDENGNPIIGDFDDYVPLEDPDNQDWTPFEDDEEPQAGHPHGDDYNPFEDDGKEPEAGGEEGDDDGEEEGDGEAEGDGDGEDNGEWENEDEWEDDSEWGGDGDGEGDGNEDGTDEFESGQEPATEDEEEPFDPEEDEEQEPYDPEEDEDEEPYDPEEEDGEEPYDPDEDEDDEPYEPDEDEDSYEPPPSLRNEPKLNPADEDYEPNDPGSAFRNWLESNNQNSTEKWNESQNLNQHLTQEIGRESQNTISQWNTDNILNQGGRNAQTIGDRSASSTAGAQDQNSWENTFSDAIEESIKKGLTSLGTTIAENASDYLVSQLFPQDKNPPPGDGGGAGGGGSAVGGGGGGGSGNGGKAVSGGGSGGGGGKGGTHSGGGKKPAGKKSGSKKPASKKPGGQKPSGKKTGAKKTGGQKGGGQRSGDGEKVTFNQPGYVDSGDSGSGDDDGQKTCIRCKKKKSHLEWDKDKIGWVCYDCLGRTVPKEEPQEEKSSGCGGPVHHGCGGCVYEAEWDDDKGGRFWKCDKCGHKDHWGPWLE